METTTLQTTVRKGYDKQWQATTYIPLQRENWRLKVSTHKSLRGILYTSVQAVKTEGNTETFTMFQDFNKSVKSFPELKRVNEKVITDAHNKSLEVIDAIVTEANEFYKNAEVED